MEKTVPELIAAISPEEWAQVPVSVLCLGLFHERETRSERLRKLIEELVRRMDKIEQEMTCTCCGTETHSPLMSHIIGKGRSGARVAAYVGLFSSQYRQSYRQIQKIMQAVFGIEMSLGTINNLRTQVSEAVSAAVTEAQEYIQQQPTVGVDETGFKQRMRSDRFPRPWKRPHSRLVSIKKHH